MSRRILIINGHPDASPERFCAALTASYRDGAERAGHEVRSVQVALLDVSFLTTRTEFESGEPPASIRGVQTDILWADHIVVVFPLWLGGMPAKLKALFEQVMRRDFAFGKNGSFGKPHLKGRSARLIVTMGMPSFVYRILFGAHGALNLKQGILELVGIGPVRSLFLGDIETRRPGQHVRWLRYAQMLGAKGR